MSTAADALSANPIAAAAGQRDWSVAEPAAALHWCERYTREHGENFTVVSWFLSRRLRAPMFAVYAFCRFTDNLGDEAPGGAEQRLRLLDEWDEDLGRAFAADAAPRHPINLALQHVAQSKPLRLDPFQKLIEANRLDQRQSRYPEFQDVLSYCELSANPVGEMVLALWEIDDDQRRRLSDATCTALQLSNHWQDVRRDFQAGRLYLPLEDLQNYDLNEDDIADQIAAGRADQRFRAMLRFQVDRAEAWFRQGEYLIDEVPRELAIDLRLFTDGGRAVLDAIRRQDYDVLARRPRVSKSTRAWLALRAAVQLKLG